MITGRQVLCFLAGCLFGFSVAWAQRSDDVITLRRSCEAEIKLCGAANVESTTEAHERYVNQLESCVGANHELAAVLHGVIERERACLGFLHLGPRVRLP